MLWNRLYGDSASDKGTLQQLQHLINHTNVPAKPKKNMNAAEDFMQVLVIGHVAALAMTHFTMTTVNDEPKHPDLLKVNQCHESEKKPFFQQALINMLRPHINLFKTPFTCVTTTAIDRVELYAQEMLTLGLLFTEFKDAIRWGDGERVFLCWKFFLPIFRAARKSNYAIEAITYLAEASVLLPPRLREQLLWSRFVNATGREGGNIAADLHMEHLNRTVKGALGNQFSNLHSGAILRTGRICGLLNSVCSVFDTQSSVAKRSTSHCSPRFESDLNKIMQQLMNSEVFRTKSGRFHRHFTKLSSPLTAHLHLKKDDFIKWLQDHLKKIIP